MERCVHAAVNKRLARTLRDKSGVLGLLCRSNNHFNPLRTQLPHQLPRHFAVRDDGVDFREIAEL